MKKHILSILLCICMIFTLLPATAMALDTTITVAGTNVVNGSNITYWLCDNGAITGTGASESNYNVKYDPAASTLTLNNASIIVSDGNAIHDSSGVNSLTILLKGNNTVKTTANDAVGIYSGRMLTIHAEEEGATLDVRGTKYGMSVSATLVIKGKATVISVGDSNGTLANHFKTEGAFKMYAGLDAGSAVAVEIPDNINNFNYRYIRIEPITNFTVTFDANGGSGTMSPQVFSNVHQELAANTFTHEYHAFAGWNTKPDGSGHSYTDKGWVWFTEPGEMTIYAQWQPMLYVEGVEVNATNAADILGDGKAKYDITTNTLTLNGATVTGDPAAEKTEGIYANADLKIMLQGENTVTASATRANAIIAIGSLTFEGSGKLNATSSGYCIQAHGGDIAISNATVNATGLGENSRGIVAFNNAGAGGDITITGGTVSAEGKTYGICASSSITVSGSTVTADATTTRDGVTAYGIYCDNITITNSTVTATASSPRHSYGIIGAGYNNGFVAITNSTVTAKGTNALNKAPALGDPADWYQWTTTENGAMTKSTEAQYTYDAIHTYLKIEPVPAPSVPVASVTIAPAALTLTEGESGTLTATVAPDNAANKAVTWTSSNPAVAIVDANGKVTAVAAGTATITATTEDGGKTAACAATVSHDYSRQDKKAEALKTAGNCRDHAVYYYSCAVCGNVEKNDSHTFNGDKVPETHVGGTGWKTDKDNHWNECACGDKLNLAAHKDENTDGKCDACAYNVGTPSAPTVPSTPSTPSAPANPSNPQTGDNSTPGMWFILLLVSAFGIAAATLLGKNRFFGK